MRRSIRQIEQQLKRVEEQKRAAGSLFDTEWMKNLTIEEQNAYLLHSADLLGRLRDSIGVAKDDPLSREIDTLKRAVNTMTSRNEEK